MANLFNEKKGLVTTLLPGDTISWKKGGFTVSFQRDGNTRLLRDKEDDKFYMPFMEGTNGFHALAELVAATHGLEVRRIQTMRANILTYQFVSSPVPRS